MKSIELTIVGYVVEVAGVDIERVGKSLHRSLCLALRELHKHCQEIEWCGVSEMAKIYNEYHTINESRVNLEIVLIVEDLLPLGNGIVYLRWDVPTGRTSRLKWFDDGSENGRIEAE